MAGFVVTSNAKSTELGELKFIQSVGGDYMNHVVSTSSPYK